MKAPRLILAILLAPTAVALATVTGVGTDTTTGANWRTAAALEADNEYGTDGYVIYGIDEADGAFRNPYAFNNDQTVLPAAITGVATNTVQMWSGTGNFGTMEDPGNGNAITNTPLSVFLAGPPSTFTISRTAGTSFRLTLLASSGDGANVTYNNTVDDGSGGVLQSSAHSANGLHYHVFDISSGSPDVVVTVSAGNHFSLTGLAFDNVVTLLPPVVDDSATTDHLTFVDIPVLDNDNPTGSVTLVEVFDDPASGTAVVQPDNSIRYTHTTGTPTSDSFTYRYTDDNGVSDLGTVTITLTHPLLAGTRIGIDLGTATSAVNWNNFSALGSIGVGSVTDLGGAMLDGVTIDVACNASTFWNPGDNNWAGLSTQGGSAPAEFVDEVTSDFGGFGGGAGSNMTITVGGLDTALDYDIYGVSQVNAATSREDTLSVTGDVSYGSSAILRSTSVAGSFHSFTEVSPDGSGTITVTLTDPTANNGIICGILIVCTGPQAPLITSAPATEVRSTSATLNGELISQGNLTTTVWVCWGDDDPGESLGSWDNKVELGTPAVGLLSHPVTGLATDTTCYCRFFATNSEGDSWSGAQSFTPTLPQLEVVAGQALEGGSGLTAVEFEVSLSYAADDDVTVDYSTAHGSTDDGDLTLGSGQVTITAGETSATITIWVNGDGDEEIDEFFTLNIDGAPGVVVGTPSVQGMILSDDGNHLSPIAVAADQAAGLVYVALQTAQRIAVVDAASEQFVRSISLPDQPNGMCLNAAATRLYVACGGPDGQVHVVDTATDAVLASWDAGHTPLSPVLSPDGLTLYVCNRFNDDVTVIEVATGNTVDRVPVEREPYAVALNASGSKLFVANLLPTGSSTSSSIAGHVTVIDTSSRTVTATISLPTGSHSLRGMCLAPDGSSLYVTHILSRYYAPTTQVTRGWINTNALTIIDPATATRTNTILLDDLDEGAANPWGVACSPDGAWLCVAHAGNHEISAIDRVAMETKLAAATGDTSYDLTFMAGLRDRIPLQGNGPRGIAVAAGKAFAAEFFSDSLGVADLPGSGSPVGRELTVGWQKPADAVRRGEMFYNDATLCLQEWQSCASCHPDARADGLNWDLLNDGFGNSKNTKSHIASMATPPAMSTGIRPDAETAIRAGLKYIQFVNRDESFALDIEAYLTALQPVPSPYLENGQLSTAALAGQQHFQNSGCANCHSGPQFTNLQKFDMGTGIGREVGWKFDTPTLLELWRSGPYLHDGRSATVRDVIETEGHGNTSALTPTEIDELIEYLLSL